MFLTETESAQGLDNVVAISQDLGRRRNDLRRTGQCNDLTDVPFGRPDLGSLNQ